MGAEQSAGKGLQPSSSVDSEDIPYTSYSVGRPIGDSPKKELKKQGTLKSSGRRAVPDDIVVVTEGTSENANLDQEPDIKAVRDMATFLPIMRGALNVPNMPDLDTLDKLDSKQLIALITRYQEHMKQCGEAVAADQSSLVTRVREIDFAINLLMEMLTDRQKKLAKYAEQFNKVHELNTTLTKMRSCIVETESLMAELNKMLVDDHKMPDFEFIPPPGAVTG